MDRYKNSLNALDEIQQKCMADFINIGWCIGLILIACCFNGCARNEIEKRVPCIIENHTTQNVYQATPAKPISRVGVLPICSEGMMDRDLSIMQKILQTTLIEQGAFEAIQIPQEFLLTQFQTSQFKSNELLPRYFLEQIKQYYDLDGVLFCEISTYDPYRPVKIGLKAQLVQTDTKKTIWMAEDFFDSHDKHVLAGIHTYCQNKKASSLELFDEAFLSSPQALATYAFETLFNTIPNNLN